VRGGENRLSAGPLGMDFGEKVTMRGPKPKLRGAKGKRPVSVDEVGMGMQSVKGSVISRGMTESPARGDECFL